jgi:hypothetical protein
MERIGMTRSGRDDFDHSDCLMANAISLKARTALGYAETARRIHFRKPLSGDGGPGLS